jgi:hypothetical protein
MTFLGESPALATTLVAMLPVAIGGMIAIAGGLATGLLNHLLKGRAEHKEGLRKKLEEMVSLAYELESSLDKQRFHYFFQTSVQEAELSPIDRMSAICEMFFQRWG